MPIRLPLLFLQIGNFLFELSDHLWSYNWLNLPYFLFLFILGKLLLHFFYFCLFDNVLLMIFPESALILHELFIKYLWLLFDFAQLFP